MSQPNGDVAERFRALASHPDLPGLMEEQRVERGGGAWTLGTVGLLAVLALLGLFTSVLFFAFCPPLGLLPAALVAFGGYALVKQLGTRSVRTAEPLERLPVLIVDERTKLESDASTSARTRRHATIQLADGSRRELEVSGAVADHLRPGDMGLAELEGAILVAFTRLEV